MNRRELLKRAAAVGGALRLANQYRPLEAASYLDDYHVFQRTMRAGGCTGSFVVNLQPVISP